MIAGCANKAVFAPKADPNAFADCPIAITLTACVLGGLKPLRKPATAGVVEGVVFVSPLTTRPFC